MEKYGEALAMRQKNSLSLLAGQYSSMCDAMKTHADTNYLQVALYAKTILFYHH